MHHLKQNFGSKLSSTCTLENNYLMYLVINKIVTHNIQIYLFILLIITIANLQT